MDDLFTRFWDNLTGRIHGPMTFRLVLQPIMASLYALRDGLGDARAGRPAYFWTIFTAPTERERLLHEGWRAVFRVGVLAIVMDVVYQVIVFRWIYPGELVAIVLLLAFIPYLIVRGPANRIARLWLGKRQ